MSYIFFNSAPTAAPTVGAQHLNAASNNGYPVTYTLKTAPEYTYTADSEFITPGITVTIDNGAGAQLPGFAGFVQGALHSFAVKLGTR